MSNTSSERVPCTRCGATILPVTAQLYGGLCARCHRKAHSTPEELAREEQDQLWKAIQKGDLEKVRQMVTKNPGLLKWPTILQHAAGVSTVPVAEYLLSLSPNLDERGSARTAG